MCWCYPRSQARDSARNNGAAVSARTHGAGAVRIGTLRPHSWLIGWRRHASFRLSRLGACTVASPPVLLVGDRQKQGENPEPTTSRSKRARVRVIWTPTLVRAPESRGVVGISAPPLVHRCTAFYVPTVTGAWTHQPIQSVHARYIARWRPRPPRRDRTLQSRSRGRAARRRFPSPAHFGSEIRPSSA